MFFSLHYDVYFLGADHKVHQWEMKEEIEKMKKEIFYLDRNHDYSSTKIKNESKAKEKNGKI